MTGSASDNAESFNAITPKRTKWWGPDRHMVVYYVTANRDELYFVTSQPEDASWMTRESWSQKGDLNVLREAYAGFHPEVRAIVEACPEVHKWALMERDPLPRWCEGRVTLLGDALFKFDKSGRDDLLPGGLERLREVAERFKQYRTIESISYTGHTDRYGKTDYNDALSLQRANTVRDYLESMGVKADKVSTAGRGNREPVVECSTKPPKPEQTVCLTPNRRVAIEVVGIK